MKNSRYGYLYAFVCQPIKKAYVGATVDPRLREQRHRLALARGKHWSSKLQSAWDSHTPTDFVMIVLGRLHEKELSKSETALIRKLGDKSLNMNSTGYGQSLEVRTRISKAQTGRKVSAKGRAAISAANSGASNGFSKLTPIQVTKMRRIREKTGMLYKELGTMFGVTKVNARSICLRKTWRSVD